MSRTGEPGRGPRVRATLLQPQVRKAFCAGVAPGGTAAVARSSDRLASMRACKDPAIPCQHETRLAAPHQELSGEQRGAIGVVVELAMQGLELIRVRGRMPAVEQLDRYAGRGHGSYSPLTTFSRWLGGLRTGCGWPG